MDRSGSSSARRRPARRGPTALSWVVGFVVILVLVLVATRSGEEASPSAIPMPTILPAESPTPTLLPTPTPLPTATPVVLPGPPSTPTPTPTPTLIPLPTRRPRRAKVDSPTCVGFSWMITANTPSLGHNFLEIEITNRCSRDLEPDDLWFTVSGWRDGGLVQTARGKPFDRVARGRSVTLALDFPGSVDWYDEIVVEWDGW